MDQETEDETPFDRELRKRIMSLLEFIGEEVFKEHGGNNGEFWNALGGAFSTVSASAISTFARTLAANHDAFPPILAVEAWESFMGTTQFEFMETLCGDDRPDDNEKDTKNTKTVTYGKS